MFVISSLCLLKPNTREASPKEKTQSGTVDKKHEAVYRKLCIWVELIFLKVVKNEVTSAELELRPLGQVTLVNAGRACNEPNAWLHMLDP